MKKVEVSIPIKAKPKDIISAFTDYKMLSEWWHVEKALIITEEGGLYTLAWNITENGFGYVSTGIIKKYNPETELVVTDFVYLNPEKTLLGPMELSITATERSGITDVYLCQSGYQSGKDWDWYYEAVKTAWPTLMKEFKEYMENKS